MTEVEIHVQVLPHGEGLPLPAYQTAHAAGLDLVAADELTLAPGERGLVPTGICVAIPDGFEMQIRPRSGLAVKHGVTLVNTPGTIDADYRGEIKILMINHGNEPFTVRRGDRIAQAVVASVAHAIMVLAPALSETKRGGGGFGSTGI